MASKIKITVIMYFTKTNFNFLEWVGRSSCVQSHGGDSFQLIPIPLESRGSQGGVERRQTVGWRMDILMQFARKVQEPGRSRNLSCLMLRRAKATEDRWRHYFQPPPASRIAPPRVNHPNPVQTPATTPSPSQ